MKLFFALFLAPLWLLSCVRGPGAELRDSAKIGEREGDPALLLRRARAFASASDYARAEQYLGLALAKGADPEVVTPLLLQVCIEDQRYRAAIAHAEQYLRHHPRAYRLRFVEATLLVATGEVARAREQLEKVLAAEPGYADAHYALAVLLRDDLGNHSQADQHFRTYLALAPDGPHAEEAEESRLTVMP